MCILVMQMKPTVFIFCDEIEEIESFDTRILKSWKFERLLFIPLICLWLRQMYCKMQFGNQQDLVKQVDYFRKENI
jgi:hypothetical protein